MAFPLRYIVIFFLLSMVSQGQCKCSYKEIDIGTERTGREVAGKLEWKVTVINTCDCFQKRVTLSCGGFDPVKPVDPRVLFPRGNNTCLIDEGQAVLAKSSVMFTYAGEPYIFWPVSSVVDRDCKT